MSSSDRVTVVVPTHGRGASVVDTITSLLANTDSGLKVVVVDQSANDATASAVAQFASNRRFSYVRSQTTGASAAGTSA